MSDRIPLLVLGLGNVLLEDDGVGAAAVALLHEGYTWPEGVRVVDGGTLGLSLLPHIEDSDAVIMVDAIRADALPGTFIRLDGDEVLPAVASRLSPHQIGVSDLLEGARWLDRYPKNVVLLGLVPESMELAVGLSPRVAQGLPILVERVIAEARALGFAAFPRNRDHASAPASHRALDVGRLAARGIRRCMS